MGSEMCIRDRRGAGGAPAAARGAGAGALGDGGDGGDQRGGAIVAVSYTPLTLPPSDLVEISVVAVSLKKKRRRKKKKKSSI